MISRTLLALGFLAIALIASPAYASTSFVETQTVNRYTDSIDGAEVSQNTGTTDTSVDWIGIVYGTVGDVSVCDTLATNGTYPPGTALWCAQQDVPNVYFNNCVYTCQSGNGSGTNIQTQGSLTTYLYTAAPTVQTFALGARGNGHDCGNDNVSGYCMLWNTTSYTPGYCADISADIGSWYNGGTLVALFAETGENASNGGGLDNSNFYLNQCKASCELGGYERCNFRFDNDLGTGATSQTQYRCYAVTGPSVFEAKPITTQGYVETQYTAITVPSSCGVTTSSCVCDATFQWSGSSWSLWAQNSTVPGCSVVIPPSTMTPPPDPSAGIVDLVIYEGGQIRWASTDPMVPEYTPHDTYDAGSCPVTSGINLSAGGVTPTTATTGSAVNLSAVVSNSGTVNTGAGFTNLFQIDADADHASVTTTKVDTSPMLNVSGTDTTTVSHTFGTAGTWYVRVCADNNASMVGAITESNEGDNCGPWTAITVTSGGGAVTSCSASPLSITTGGSTTWTALPAGLASYTFTPSETGTGVVRATNTYARTYSTAGSYGMSVTAGGATVACSNTVTVGNPSCGTATPTITAVPDRVTSGGTSVITVSATGVDGTCTVTGPGVNQTLTGASCGVPSTNITTGPLSGQSTFTISCDGGETTAKAVVNVTTNWSIF